MLAIACIVVALIEHETEPTVAFGALDRDAAVTQPNIAPWPIAAAVLVALGTALAPSPKVTTSTRPPPPCSSSDPLYAAFAFA